MVGNSGGNLGEPRTIIVAVVGPMACDGIARCNQKLEKKLGRGRRKYEEKSEKQYSFSRLQITVARLTTVCIDCAEQPDTVDILE